MELSSCHQLAPTGALVVLVVKIQIKQQVLIVRGKINTSAQKNHHNIEKQEADDDDAEVELTQG